MKNLDLGLKNVGYKNYIINGNCAIAQRGSSFSLPVSNAFAVDRFLCYTDGSGGSGSLGQGTFAPGNVPWDTKEDVNFLIWNQSGAATGDTFRVIEYRVENPFTLSSKTVTLSFWANSASPLNLTLQAFQIFGSGGSAPVFFFSQVVAITSTMTKYTITFDVPSVAGKTAGTDGYLALQWSLPINTAFYYQMGELMLNEGPDAAPFQLAGHSAGGELALCQRYYEVIPAGLRTINGNSASGTSANVRNNWIFKVSKRTTPTVTSQSGSADVINSEFASFIVTGVGTNNGFDLGIATADAEL